MSCPHTITTHIMTNLIGLIICFLYIFIVIGTAEGLRRWKGYSSSFTRKVIHIGVGMMIWIVPYLFTSPWPFVFASAFFAVLNLFDYKFGFFSAMASSDKSNLGTVYFPIAAAVVALVFWEQPPLMVAAVMPLTWGDGLASVVGKKYGRHIYHIHTSTRSIEGSAGFFIACFFFTWLALWLVEGLPNLTPMAAILPALAVTIAARIAEAISIWGLDNLTITAVTIIILQVWPF